MEIKVRKPRIRTQKSELVSSTVVGKEWSLKQLRDGRGNKLPGAILPTKIRNTSVWHIPSTFKNYDQSISTGEGTLC